MSASLFDSIGRPLFATRGARVVLVLLAVVAFTSARADDAKAPPTTSPAAAERAEVPDGSPQLAAEKSVSNTSTTAKSRSEGSVIVEEERVQGRLANARISVGGGRAYSIVDPNAGRVDRQADNGGKRVTPSLWELFRF